ncbi:MAG: trehalase family glycosidase [Flavobacteriaceae bacterium]
MLFHLNIKETLNRLLSQEDTDGDNKITKEDKGPKQFSICSTEGETYLVKGTYRLSNLLQELALEKAQGKILAEIPLERIEERPSGRISRMIRDYFWDDLTRTVDDKGLSKVLSDEKASDRVQRIYVPFGDEAGRDYFSGLQSKYPNLEVVVLPEDISPEYVKSIDQRPGILSLGIVDGKGVPFVVPGGRFNEMYGWDSYFQGVGLLLDGRVDLAKAMVDNFCYQIVHYGKILNANRSYYLTRTQPPFLSSFIREVFEAGANRDTQWLSGVLEIAILEYESVWMEKGKRQVPMGLNRYLASGLGIPPETEPGHFDEVLTEYAQKHGLKKDVFEEQYAKGVIKDAQLDQYFTHDRSLRESGHDTSWRLDNCCADLVTVDLNSLLYKYETDFEYLINTYFDGVFTTSKGREYTSGEWQQKAKLRRKLVRTHLWNGAEGIFYDYDFIRKKQTGFGAATNFYPLWARLCTQEEAQKLVKVLMGEYKDKGGILGTTKKSIEGIAEGKAQRQWDWPNGWAPHQMLIWRGLQHYGFERELNELVYRWLWMITKNAVDYNGTIPEKYDVVACTHKDYAEYGNVGTDFDYITTSGFGWMNASYQLGLSLLPPDLVEPLDELMNPDVIFGR